MTLPPPPDFDPTRPKWTQIAEALRQRITTGDYPPHHLISEVQFAGTRDAHRALREVAATDSGKRHLLRIVPLGLRSGAHPPFGAFYFVPRSGPNFDGAL